LYPVEVEEALDGDFEVKLTKFIQGFNGSKLLLLNP
jgi:hypothetical protein